MPHPIDPLDRRALLRALCLWPAAMATTAPAWAQAAADGAGLVTPNVCVLMPETTEGPYYIDPDLVRVDITEGRPGVPLEMVLQVVTGDCAPVQGARVDIWHCDAAGNYSGFARQGSDRAEDTRGETFLRGTQFTDQGGVARFSTIYPGWYRGRTTHIHHMIFLDARTVLTSQVFFPEEVSTAVFATPDYAARAGGRDTMNAEDGIARRAGRVAVAEVARRGNGLVASLVVGIDPAAG